MCDNRKAGTLSELEQRLLDIDDWIQVDDLGLDDLLQVMQLEEESCSYFKKKTAENSHCQDVIFWETPEGYWDFEGEVEDEEAGDSGYSTDSEREARWARRRQLDGWIF